MTDKQIDALVNFLVARQDSHDGLVVLDRFGNTYLDKEGLRQALTLFFSEGA